MLKSKTRPQIQIQNAALDVAVPALECEAVTVTYNGQPALEEINLSVGAGTRVAVVGPNGAGKSTLFKAIVGLLPLASGRIQINGAPLHQATIGYVTQREEVDWTFPVTVEDVVMMGRYGRLSWLRWPGRRDREIVRRALEQVGMTAFAQRQIGELSGGQQQRVFIARALAQEAELLLLDEPFSGVDVSTREAIFDLLDDLRHQGITILVSTHDLNMALKRFEQLLLLNRHLVAYGSPEEVFTPRTLTETYGRGVVTWRPGEEVVMVDDSFCEGCKR
jgi:ABC-type Mn2+/Zn2+ transport system ATPase subunit